MTLRLASVTFDAADPLALARFWSAALDRPIAEGASDAFASLDAPHGGPIMMFLRVPEAKTAKNRMHVDLTAADRDAEVARLVGLGATRHGEHTEFGHQWTVLTDPEGNEFCVAQR